MTALVSLNRRQIADIRIGVCVRRDPLKATPTSDAALMAMLATVGARVVRMTLDWTQVERKPGVYTWTQYEGFVAGLKAVGIAPLLILQAGNPLYTGDWRKPPITPHAQAAYGRFFAAAVAKFGQGSTVYEIQNEPNHPGEVFFTPDQYAGLVSAVLAATAKRAPTWLLTGGLSYHDRDNWLRAVASKVDLSRVTAISHHPYTGGDSYPNDPMCRPEAMGANLDAVAKIASRPVFNTEVGVSVTECAGATWADKLQRQGEHAWRFVMGSLIAARPFSCWYALQDAGTDRSQREHNFGLFDAAGTIKPAGLAFGQAMRSLATAENVEIDSVDRDHRATLRLADDVIGLRSVVDWTA